MKKYPLTLSLILLAGIYGGLKLVRPPLPSSLVAIYMAMTLIAVLLYASTTEESWKSFTASLRALVVAPERKIIRGAVLVLLPCVVGLWTYGKLAPELEPPAAIRPDQVPHCVSRVESMTVFVPAMIVWRGSSSATVRAVNMTSASMPRSAASQRTRVARSGSTMSIVSGPIRVCE